MEVLYEQTEKGNNSYKKQRDMYFKMRNGLKDTMSINNKRYKTFRRNLNEQIDILDYILMKIGGTNE